MENSVAPVVDTYSGDSVVGDVVGAGDGEGYGSAGGSKAGTGEVGAV